MHLTNKLLPLVCLMASTTLLAQPPGFGPDRRRDLGDQARFQVTAPRDLPFNLGVAGIKDREPFEKLSYQGPMRMDGYLSGREFVKFIVKDANSDHSQMYWMNTENFQAHSHFMREIGMEARWSWTARTTTRGTDQ